MLAEALLWGFLVCNVGNPQSHILTHTSCKVVGPYMTYTEARHDAKKIKTPYQATRPAPWDTIRLLEVESKSYD